MPEAHLGTHSRSRKKCSSAFRRKKRKRHSQAKTGDARTVRAILGRIGSLSCEAWLRGCRSPLEREKRSSYRSSLKIQEVRVTLHDEVEEFKDMAGIGRQARPYKERTSVLAPHSATIYELLFSESIRSGSFSAVDAGFVASPIRPSGASSSSRAGISQR